MNYAGVEIQIWDAYNTRFNSSSTRVTGVHPKKVKQASKLYPAGTVATVTR